MFLINSRLGHFTAAPPSLQSKSDHQAGHSFSRSYGVIMPSSLTIVLPIALVCSTCLPVSVLVRAPTSLPRGFSWKRGITDFTKSLRRHISALRCADFPTHQPTCFHGDVQNPAQLSFSVTPLVITACQWYRNVYLLCIDYALRPRLSSRLTLGGLASPRNP